MKTSFDNMRDREINARRNFVNQLIEIADISQDDAQRVCSFYLDHKLAKMDYGIGRIQVLYGSYLDKSAILGAVAASKIAK